MQAPVPHLAVDRYGLERIDAVNQAVLDAQLSHGVLRPGLATRLPRQAKAVSFHAPEKRREIDQIFARRDEGLRALEQNDPRFQSSRDFKRALPSLPDLVRLAK